MQKIFAEDVEFNRAQFALLAERHNEKYYRSSLEWRAAFCERFTPEKLKTLELSEYVIGTGRKDTFCYFLESGTPKLGSFAARSSLVFGVYFDKKKQDYIALPKWSKNKDGNEAIIRIREALDDLYLAGQSKNFEGIEKSNLPNQFKRKILSLYFPDDYIGAYSDEFVKKALDICGITHMATESFEELRAKLLKFKNETPPFSEYHSQLFVDYLYKSYKADMAQMGADEQAIIEVLYDDDWKLGEERQRPPAPKGKGNYEGHEKNKRALGRKAEDIVFSEERKKLQGTSYKPKHISDDDDGAGYDIESFELDGTPLHIEVKASGRDSILDFYLSWNEDQKLQTDPAYVIYYVCNVNTQYPKIRRVNAELIRNGTIIKRPDTYRISYNIEKK